VKGGRGVESAADHMSDKEEQYARIEVGEDIVGKAVGVHDLRHRMRERGRKRKQKTVSTMEKSCMKGNLFLRQLAK
jgi:hypothetical protein